MYLRTTEHLLLLFGCLILIFSLYGTSPVLASKKNSAKVSADTDHDTEQFMTIRNNEKVGHKKHEMDAVLSSGRNSLKHDKFKGIRQSVIKKIKWNKITQTGFHNGSLKQQLLKRQMIAPGYYQAECSEKKPCKEGMYCNVLYCEKCHKLNVGCSGKEQCCKGLVCTYGRCEKKAKGDPGTFCEKDTDCKEACCVLEPTINTHLPICKPTLEEYHQCASILYRKIWVGEKPDCGPCKPGLECVQKGVFGSHEVCMKPE